MTTATHVTNIIHSAHTAHGVIVFDATDRSPVEGIIDYRPVITNYVHAKTGRVLYSKTGGIGRTTVWKNAKGEVLDWHEEPEIEPIEKILAQWGGFECSNII